MLTQSKPEIQEACAELEKYGFSCRQDGAWIGKLGTLEGKQVAAKVILPQHFPYELPLIYINREELPRRIPHIEQNGKICLAPTSGILLDASRPAKLIQESLEQATHVIQSGLEGTNKSDLINEFIAYWDEALESGLCSVCDPEGPSRRVFACKVRGWNGVKKADVLIADSKAIADSWADAIGKKADPLPGVFFIRLENPFLPPNYQEVYSVNTILGILGETASSESLETLNKWFQERKLPVDIILSIPLDKNLGRGLVGIHVPKLSGHASKLAQRGWPPNKTTAIHDFHFGGAVQIKRLFVARLDKDYLVSRCGSEPKLSSKTVVLIGCGSVGSHVATLLASMGVGKVRLIDHESFKAENIHRHVLGILAINYNKAESLGVFLGTNYPHIRFEARGKKVQDVLATEQDFINGSDLIVIAVGDETLEIWLNQNLGIGKPRVHVWTEPLGIGQHVLATGLSSHTGCYECLFEPEDRFGLINQSAFAGPGQPFHQSLAGCGGSFISFSSIDAVRAAVEAASLIQEILTETAETTSVLISRFGESRVFISKGYQLSRRANLFNPGQVIRTNNFVRKECPACARCT